MGGQRLRKVAFAFLGFVVLGVAAVVAKVALDRHYQAIDQALMAKEDSELLGRHLYLPRGDDEPVDVNLYAPDGVAQEPLPVVINIHGGAFVAGDADTLDTQSARIAQAWNAVVVTVNYKLASDGHTIEYATREVVDTARYLIAHAEEYGIDPGRLVMLGYSAGGYHAMAATIMLEAEGVDVYAQVLCYPFLRDALERFQALPETSQRAMAPALFVLADDEPIGKGSLPYEEALHAAGVPTEVLTYAGALHGFIEENNPEYERLHSKASKSPEQEVLARKAEADIGTWLQRLPVS